MFKVPLNPIVKFMKDYVQDQLLKNKMKYAQWVEIMVFNMQIIKWW